MEFTKEKSQEIADKLTSVFNAVAILTDEDLAYLLEVENGIELDISKFEAGMGVLFDYHKAEMKIRLANESLKRLQGVRLIHSAMGEYWKINLDYAVKEKQKTDFEKSVGL